jgi:hypothetical protein
MYRKQVFKEGLTRIIDSAGAADCAGSGSGAGVARSIGGSHGSQRYFNKNELKGTQYVGWSQYVGWIQYADHYLCLHCCRPFNHFTDMFSLKDPMQSALCTQLQQEHPLDVQGLEHSMQIGGGPGELTAPSVD